MKIKQGDTIHILPAYQDAGDDLFTWKAVSDEEKGRVDISPIDIGFPILPVMTINTNMVKGA